MAAGFIGSFVGASIVAKSPKPQVETIDNTKNQDLTYESFNRTIRSFEPIPYEIQLYVSPGMEKQARAILNG